MWSYILVALIGAALALLALALLVANELVDMKRDW